MFFCFFFFLFGWISFAVAELEDVYLWKGKNSLQGQSVSIPQHLVITSYARSIPSPLFQKVDHFLTPPYLEGRECSANRDIYSLQRVKGVLPPNTPLEAVEAFHVLPNPAFMRKLILKILDFKGIGTKGGPATFYLVKGPKDNEFILNKIIAYELNFYLYNSPSAKKAENILSHFKKNNQKIKRVSLTFELTEEHNEKCGWGWPKGEEPKKIKPEEEIKILMRRAVQFMQKHSSFYVFENIQTRSDQIELGLNEKALAFLILNSSPLRIKDISLASNRLN